MLHPGQETIFNAPLLRDVAIIGSGSWATALVKIFAGSGIHVSWLVRDEAQAKVIKATGRNPRYLSFARLPIDQVEPSAVVADVLAPAELVIFAVPAAYLEDSVAGIEPAWLEGKKLAVSIKGFIPGTGLIPGTFLSKRLGNDQPVMVIGGPCHAEEVATDGKTYVTIAGADSAWVERICQSIRLPYIQVIANDDPAGVEYASILKNIIGIATGIADGLNYGVNFQAVLVSNAMREVDVLLNAVQPGKRCLYDSVYFGDLLVTAYSDFSRNRTLGKLLGRGMQISRAMQSMVMVAEGYSASRELFPLLKKLQLSTPILTSVYRILRQHANPFHEFKLIEQRLR